LLLGFALLIVLLSATSARSDESPPSNTRWAETSPQNVELGKATFGLCMSCHGDGAAGRIGIGPRIASESYLAAASDDFLAATIKKGRAATTMIPWEAILNDQQVEALIAYLRSLQPVAPAKLDESKLAGNVENGAEVFRSVCSGCHGRSGAGYQETANGTGIGRKAFLDSASNGFIRYIVSHGKSQTKMRGFASKNVTAVANLSKQEIDDTIAYLRANAW
jgi:cbb3-type cytochrome c oxidase subunit III